MLGFIFHCYLSYPFCIFFFQSRKERKLEVLVHLLNYKRFTTFQESSTFFGTAFFIFALSVSKVKPFPSAGNSFSVYIHLFFLFWKSHYSFTWKRFLMLLISGLQIPHSKHVRRDDICCPCSHSTHLYFL